MSTSSILTTMQHTHILDPAHFDLLTQAPDRLVPNPQYVTAVVAERDGRLLGRRFLCLVPHVEGAWQLPECDVSTLESELDAHINALGLRGVMRAAPVHEDLSAYGYVPLPMMLWVKQPAAPQQATAPAPTLTLVTEARG